MRIGAVNYLNSKPLVYRLADRAPHARLLFDLPSRLADSLAAGRLDVALVPCFEFLSDPSYVMASDACVASRGPVRSVKLYFRTQPADVRKLALDEGSRTSAALSHVLLHRRHGLRPEISRLPIGSGVEAADADAVLLIGDRAMTPPREPFVAAWDLGEEWLRWARLPFVFACWATPSRAVAEEIAPVLAASRDEGEGLLSEIAAVEGPKLDLQAGDAYGYLTQNLHYRIGADERRSIALYRSECERIGLLPTGSAERPGGWPGMNAADLMNAGPGRTRPGRLTPSDWERPSRPFFDEQAPMSIASQAVRPTRKPAAPRTPREPIQPLLDKAVGGERLSPAEGLRLLQSHDLAALGRAADEVTRRRHPEPYRTYNIDRNINYTNVCTAVCDFCAFYRGPKSDEGYVLSLDQILHKIEETIATGGDQILLQGGLHPKFKLDWYEEMLSGIKARFPQVNIHGFSPPEIHHFTKVNRLPLRTVLERLRDAGLGSLPGGGAEILVDRVRKEITRGKVLSDDWLNVMRVWHQLGGRSSATMMFGHVETLAERIEHLERLRQLQDESLAQTPGSFTAFICWTFQPDNTQMSHIPPTGSFEYLKTNAVARLYLDNFDNLQSSWVTQGLKVGQLALNYGANDMGSLMIEENVVAEAGTVHYLTLNQIRDAITECGYKPRQRNVHYQLIENEFIPPPDDATGPRLPQLPVVS